MKLKWLFIVSSTFLFGVGCSSMVAVAARSSCDWQFIQSVGGMAIDKPHRDARGHVLLPIRCDVSGTQTITVKPTGVNSGLVCEPPVVRLQSGTILLTVRKTVASSHYSNAHCPPADLGALAPGKYAVIYLSPDGRQHPLGIVNIPPR